MNSVFITFVNRIQTQFYVSRSAFSYKFIKMGLHHFVPSPFISALCFHTPIFVSFLHLSMESL